MLSLALTKFWYNTSPQSIDKPHMEPIVGGLTLRIYTIADPGASKHFGSPLKDQLIMEIWYKDQCLEHLDIKARNAASLAAMAAAKTHGLNVNVKELPFVGLSQRDSCTFALRYKIESQQIRRLQLQFSRVHQYDQVLSSLKSAGVIFQESQTRSASRDGSRPQTAPPGMARPLSRPTSAHMVPNHVQAGSRGYGLSNISPGYSSGGQTQGLFQQRNELQLQSLAVLQPVRGDPYAIRPSSAISSISASEGSNDNAEKMPPPATTNIRNIYSSGNDDIRPHSASGSGRGPQSLTDNVNMIISSPLPPRRELPFSRPQTAPQQTSRTETGSPSTSLPRSATTKKQTPASRRASSSTSGNAPTKASKRKVAQRSQTMAVSPAQPPAAIAPTSATTTSPSTTMATTWDEHSVTLAEMPNPAPLSFDNLHGFRQLSESAKNEMITQVVNHVGEKLTDDFIDFCARLEESVTARIGLKHLVAME